ncbi:hypothetical protein LJR234_006029 [Mesorhizobium amorphae]|uniref:hypothetical protein n=1 Tax=Mesorhizobium amorphae TaxID=71433 RepID=UPI003ECDAB41
MADESYAQTVATDNALWRRLDGENSVSSIRGIWLGSNPKRAVMRLVGLAKNMAAAAEDGLRAPSEITMFISFSRAPL